MKSDLPDLPLSSEQIVPYVTIHYEYLGMFGFSLAQKFKNTLLKNNIKGKAYLFKQCLNQHHTKISSLSNLNRSTSILIYL